MPKVDVGLDESGDLPMRTGHISGVDLVVQRIQRRIRTVKGEWMADGRVGLPYFSWFQQKPLRVDEVGAAVRSVIETTPGVQRLEDWRGSIDLATRAVTFSGTIKTAEADIRLTVARVGEPGADNFSPSINYLISRG